VRQPGRSIFPGHRTSETEALFGRDVWRHSNAADRKTACSIVNHRNGFQTDMGPVNVDDLGWTELVCESKHIPYEALPVITQAARTSPWIGPPTDGP